MEDGGRWPAANSIAPPSLIFPGNREIYRENRFLDVVSAARVSVSPFVMGINIKVLRE